MSNYPVKIKRRAVKPSGEPKSAMMAAPESRSGHGTFRYAYASLSFAGDGQKAHLNARRVEWNGDKLETESFEGDVDPATFERALAYAQRQLLEQTALFWQPFAAFLPFYRRPRHRD